VETALLVVDDEQDFLDSMTRMLRLEGYEQTTAVADPTRIVDLLAEQTFAVAFLDITMPEMDGLELLAAIKERSPATECVMVTADDRISAVVKAVKLGAYDYLVKPITPDLLAQSLDRALEHKRLVESLRLRSSRLVAEELDNPEAFDEIVTTNEAMLRMLREAELHAASEIPILITGETGVGKELLARAVHRASRRARGPFVPVNMLALSPTLFESEFFGHVRGAFTGADKNKVGYLGKAAGGTLFLDEIGDLSKELQGKLLRILQEGEYAPVGDTKTVRANARFVAATNQDLQELVEKGEFRKDLFYRLQFAHLEIPPLRERLDDLAVLGDHFLRGSATVSDAAWDLLTAYEWPGNVRELEGVLQAAANLSSGGPITADHFKLPNMKGEKASATAAGGRGELEPMRDVERRHILAVYRAVDNNKSQAARVLGIGLQTLHRKLKAYGAK
jgi:DNA-binding NtrC family response regulator